MYIQRFDSYEVVLPYNNVSCLGLFYCVREFISDGPRNFNISDHVDRLECSADGNPAPMYTWTNVETNMSINGSAYTLNLTNNKEHTLYCTAENILAFVRKNYTIKGCLVMYCIWILHDI